MTCTEKEESDRGRESVRERLSKKDRDTIAMEKKASKISTEKSENI